MPNRIKEKVSVLPKSMAYAEVSYNEESFSGRSAPLSHRKVKM